MEKMCFLFFFLQKVTGKHQRVKKLISGEIYKFKMCKVLKCCPNNKKKILHGITYLLLPLVFSVECSCGLCPLEWIYL